MLFAFLSILSGLGDAISFTVLKKMSSEDKIVVLAYRHIASLPFLLLALLFFGFSDVSSSFYLVTIANTIFLLLGVYLTIVAFEKTDLSVSVPMLSFTPAFIIVISYVFLREIPSLWGMMGILLVVMGSYILNITSSAGGIMEPFRQFWKNKGILAMLGASFLFAITSVLSKIGIQLSNPIHYMVMTYLFAAAILSIMFFGKISSSFGFIKRNKANLLVLGTSTAIMEILAGFALKMALVSYAISLKRSSILFSVLIGIFLFRERRIKEALFGGSIMFIGAVLIAMAQ